MVVGAPVMTRLCGGIVVVEQILWPAKLRAIGAVCCGWNTFCGKRELTPQGATEYHLGRGEEKIRIRVVA